MNYEAAAIIARYEQEAIRRRADFAAALGGLVRVQRGRWPR